MVTSAMAMNQFPDKLRSLFPITEKFAYLNHASAGPLSRLTRDCMANVLDRAMYLGPHAFEDLGQMQLTAQHRAAQLVNAKTATKLHFFATLPMPSLRLPMGFPGAGEIIW